MGGATSMMSVIRDAFSQQVADTTQWADTIDWTVRPDHCFLRRRFQTMIKRLKSATHSVTSLSSRLTWFQFHRRVEIYSR